MNRIKVFLAVAGGLAAAASAFAAQAATSTPLSAACSGSAIDNVITWTAAPASGSPPYSFLWSGAQIAGNTSSSVMGMYPATGTYDAAIQITDASSSVATSTCFATVTSLPVATTTTPSAELSIAQFGDNATPNTGDIVHFTVTVSAVGPATSTGVTATDILPAGITFLSAAPSVGAYSTSTGMWTIGDLSASSSAILTLSTMISASSTTTSTITNTASVQESSAVIDPDTTNNSSSVTLTVPGSGITTPTSTPTSTPMTSGLSILKTVDNSTPTVGNTVDYLLIVSALGPGTSTAATATDVLPAGLTFISATPSTGAYSTSTGMWTIGDLSASSTATLSIAASVSSGTAGQTITNVATAGSASSSAAIMVQTITTSTPTSSIPLSVSCDWGYDAANVITWTSSVTGGTGGPYTYLWSGSQVNGNTSSSVAATYPATGAYTATIQAMDTVGNTGMTTCSASITSIPTSPSSTPTNPGTIIPPMLSIGPNGSFLGRGMVVTSIASTSFQATIWGITYTINWNGKLPQFFFRFGGNHSNWTPSQQLNVGDIVGVSGWITPADPLVVNAEVVRDYSLLSPRAPHVFFNFQNIFNGRRR